MLRPLHYALFTAALLLGFQSISLSRAHAESRLALVIGQSAYRSVPALPNPANDAKVMSQLLNDAGFDVLTAADLSQSDMRATVSEFATKIANTGPDTIALVFYAGHGLQIDGENYLVPVDIDPQREADIPLQAVRLNDILNTLGSVPNRMRILLLDACRNNPFPELSKTAGHGFAIVDAKTGSTGTFISYSTSPGAEAEDGRGINSPYTTALVKAAREPGLSIEETFKRVRMSVNHDTSGRQTPWDSSSLTDAFRFFPAKDQDDTRAPTPPKRSVDEWKKQLQGKEPQAAYDLVIADDTVEAYEAFVALFAQPPYATQVRPLLDRRREMIAWQATVFINTGSSYRSFLESYPNSDLAATARKLAERLRNRSLNANAAAPALAPTNVSLAGPSCPCGQPSMTPAIKKVDDDKPPKHAAKPPKHVADNPPRRRRGRPSDDDDVIYDAPPRQAYGPPIIGGVGIGLGGGGYGGGGYGGGYGGRGRRY
jgi:caspase domain-containing protein